MEAKNMSLENLSNEIAATAEAEAKAIIADAKVEAKAIMAAAITEAEALTEANSKKASREAEQVSRELVASARQANQKRLLIAKREEIESTLSSIREQVGSAGMKGRAAMLKTLVATAEKISEGKMVMRPFALDRKVLDKESGSFTLGDDVDGLGGFILEAADGSVSYDFRFDGLLDDSWAAKLPQVNDTLFG